MNCDIASKMKLRLAKGFQNNHPNLSKANCCRIFHLAMSVVISSAFLDGCELTGENLRTVLLLPDCYHGDISMAFPGFLLHSLTLHILKTFQGELELTLAPSRDYAALVETWMATDYFLLPLFCFYFNL